MFSTKIAPDRPPVRVVLADDHSMFRDAVRLVLHSHPGFSVVGEAGDGIKALQCVGNLEPDVLLLDVNMPRLGGLDTLERLQAQASPVRTVMLTAELERADALIAIRRGARGILLKDVVPETFFRCLETVVEGGFWLDPTFIQHLLGTRASGGEMPPPARPRDSLTPREWQVLSGVVDGDSNQDVGRALGISEQTVKNHLNSIFDKLGVSSRLELAVHEMQHQMLAAYDPIERAAPRAAAGIVLGTRDTRSLRRA